MRIFCRFLLLGFVLVLCQSAVPLRAQTTPEDGAGAYKTGVYRNLFVENGHTAAEAHAKVQAAFQQLFHGDAQTQAIAFDAGKNANGPLMYLSDIGNHDVRTEGMSYGMMIAVQLDKKAEFDALWNWAKTYMYVADPKHPSHPYFSWSCKLTGEPNAETAAPDGEEYFAMALLFASNRWGDGKGLYNYKAEALQLLSAMRHHPVVSGPTKFGPRTVGPEVDEAHAMILFVPDVGPFGSFTDPSYHLPAFYELWARWGPVEDRPFWRRAAQVSRAFFVQTTDAKTGLNPAYANFDGTPHVTPWPLASIFSYDAWRTASNWSVDWSWWAKAPAEPQLSDRIQKFFLSQGIGAYGALYKLDGTYAGGTPQPPPQEHPAGLVSANAVAGLAATHRETARQFTEELWKTPIPAGHDRYYDGMLYLMSLMHASGEFRIWGPK